MSNQKKPGKWIRYATAFGLLLCFCLIQPVFGTIVDAREIAAANPDASPTPFNGVDISSESEISELSLEDAIHITTLREFQDMAENCVIDSWSKGKVFVLDNDLDFSTAAFTPVPTFGGIFIGNGHTIKGFTQDAGSDNTGLFRYLQESGEIYDLFINGTATAESSHDGLSLLVGYNKGIISGCHVTGNLNGGDDVGMITGYNDVTGIISECLSEGVVYGNHRIGAIAGTNAGSILNCVNRARVNTTVEEGDLDISMLTVDDLLSTENVASVTDIGGIAGSNTGIIRASVNNGTVGYQHVGYNVGGIAGSQMGYIEGCINYGVLHGRKDVGGIAGQMEPSSEMLYNEDTLDKLHTELNKLHDLVTKMTDDASDTSTDLNSQLNKLLDAVESTQRAADSIADEASGDMHSFSSELTNLSSLPTPRPISLDFLDSIPTLSPSPSMTPEGTQDPNATPTVTPTVTPSVTPSATPAVAPTVTPAATPVQGNGRTQGNSAGNSSTGSGIPASTPVSENNTLQDDDTGSQTGSYTMKTTMSQPAPVTVRMTEPGSPVSPQDQNDAPTLTPTPIAAPTPTVTPEPTRSPWAWPSGVPTIDPSALPQISDYNFDKDAAEKELNKMQDNVYNSTSSALNSMKNTLGNRTSIFSSRINSWHTALSSGFSSIISESRTLNNMVDDKSQLLLDDLQAITDELNVIGNIITTADDDVTDPEDLVTDVSDEDKETDITGKVMNCQNKGKVYGDLNVGGVAGSMSRENDLDPEDDISLSDTSMNFRYQQRIVIRKSENSGVITGKKDCVGGIVGNMVLGSVISCIGNGDVSSEGGDMVGGIAGFSDSTIRESSAKCALSGENQIGGIAGSGKTIKNCYSMIEITEGTNYLGSIAGKADVNDDISENYFVEGCPAGIDGVSYEEKAQPLPYGSFLCFDNLPSIYQNITLTFMADDRLVTTVTLSYGESFDPTKLPKVPEKKGYAGKWEDFNTSSLTFDQTINAVYTEYLSTLESSEKDDTGKALALVEGTFKEGDRFLLTSIDAYPEDSKTKAECKKISILNGTGPFTVRYLIPEGIEDPEIEIYDNGAFVPVSGYIDGSYYVFNTDKQEFIFACLERPASLLPIFCGVAAGVLLILFIVLRIVKKKKAKAAQK